MEDLNLNDQPLEYILRITKRHVEQLKDACNHFFSFMRKGPEAPDFIIQCPDVETSKIVGEDLKRNKEEAWGKIAGVPNTHNERSASLKAFTEVVDSIEAFIRLYRAIDKGLKATWCPFAVTGPEEETLKKEMKNSLVKVARHVEMADCWQRLTRDTISREVFLEKYNDLAEQFQSFQVSDELETSSLLLKCHADKASSEAH